LAKDDADEASVKREVREDEEGVRGEGDEVEEDESAWTGEYGEVFALSMGSSWAGTETFGSVKAHGATSTDGERYVMVGLRRRVDVGGGTT
jgi:hypothetical protein